MEEKLIEALLYALVLLGDREATNEMAGKPVPRMADTIDTLKKHRKALQRQQVGIAEIFAEDTADRLLHEDDNVERNP